MKYEERILAYIDLLANYKAALRLDPNSTLYRENLNRVRSLK